MPFKNLPAALRVPLFYAELDNSQANTAQALQRTLIIGQVTAGGNAVLNVPLMSQGVPDAALVGGLGSVLHLMTQAYRRNDPDGEVWYLPLADDPAAIAATGTVTITAPATATGTLYLYIGGVRIAQAILPTQTTAQIATALVTSINATPALPVLASVNAAVVTLTAINKGPTGNEIDLRLNYQGSRGGEVLPVGLALTVAPMTGGATAPSMAGAFANLGNMMFDFIICPYTDTISLNAVQALLNDQTGRWCWSAQLYGHAFACKSGTVATLTTFGLARNDQHASVLGVYDSPTPAYICAALWAGSVAPSLRNDPGQPLQTLAIGGMLAPPIQSRFILADRNILLYDGISTFTVADDGTVAVENLITTYQKNANGVADNSYLQIETLYTLAFVLRFMRTVITSKYARVKLAANGTRLAPGANVVTPNVIRGEIIAIYRTLESDYGLVENGDAFARGLIVQQNAANPNRIDVLWPGDLINQLRIFAVLAQFRL
jgi:phage tail sheath gpL-like